MRGSATLAAAAASALLSCGPTRAAIVVRVDTDFTQAPMGDLRSVRVRVYSGYGPARTPRHDSVRPLGDALRLPFRFAVLPLDDGESGVVTVEVVGCTDETCGDERPGYAPVLVEQRAIVSFIPGQVWELPMLLAANCRGVRCDTVDPRLESTCSPASGMCENVRTPPTGDASADAGDATAPPDRALDVGGDNGAPDAARDAERDAPSDGARDAEAALDVARDADAALPRDADDAAMNADGSAAQDADVALPMDADVAAPMDLPADLGLDADVPAGMDVAPDADAPAPPDAPADVPLEPVRSCGTGASAQTCRASEDCCILGSCGCLLVAVCTPRGLIGCR